MTECVSRLVLMQLRAGELSDDRRSAVLHHIEACEHCRASFESMRENIADFEPGRAAHLEKLMPYIALADQAIRKQRFNRIAALTAIAAAALVLITFVLTLAPTPSEEVIAFKGELSVAVIGQRDHRQFEVHEGTRLRESDALRFVITTGSAGYLYVFSMDATGRISSYYPESPPSSNPEPMRVDRPGRRELPGSVVLDEAVGQETFVIIFSPSTFKRDIAVSEWKASVQLSGKDMLVEEITILKETRRPQ